MSFVGGGLIASSKCPVLFKIFTDGRTLWETLAGSDSVHPILSELPSPAVLLQGRNLRGNVPFFYRIC
jgi:hypothetical protein